MTAEVAPFLAAAPVAARRNVVWPALALGAASIAAVVMRLAMLEQAPFTRARLIVAHAGAAGLLAGAIAFWLARWLDRRWSPGAVALAVGVLILIGLPTAMAGLYAVYDRTWLGHIEEDTLAEGVIGVAIAHAGAVYLFATMGLRLLFPWGAPLVALIAAAIAWGQRR